MKYFHLSYYLPALLIVLFAIIKFVFAYILFQLLFYFSKSHNIAKIIKNEKIRQKDTKQQKEFEQSQIDSNKNKSKHTERPLNIDELFKWQKRKYNKK